MNSEDQVMNNSANSNEDMALSNFQLLTENDMHYIIQRYARESCEFDPMPTSVVLSCLDELLSVITHMVNSSLACGYFPFDWKGALVNLLLKGYFSGQSHFSGINVKLAEKNKYATHSVQRSLEMCENK